MSYIFEREILDGYLVGISNNPAKYLLDTVLPETPGKAKGSIIRDSDDQQYGGDPDNSPERLPGDDISEGKIDRLDDVPYNCKLMDRAYPVAWEDIRRSQLPLPLIQRAQKKSLHYIKVHEERRFVSILLDSAWTYDVALDAADRFDVSTGDPMDAIDALVDGLPVDEGLTMIASYNVAHAISRNAILRNTLNTAADRTKISMQRFLDAYGYERGIENAYVMSAKYNTAKGTTRSLARVGGASGWVWIGVINPGSGVMVDTDLHLNPTALVRVVEQPYAPQQWEEPKKKSTMIGTECSQAIQAVDLTLGGLITTVTG